VTLLEATMKGSRMTKSLKVYYAKTTKIMLDFIKRKNNCLTKEETEARFNLYIELSVLNERGDR
jgi:hypothetical protein